jgi:hypothetical protein
VYHNHDGEAVDGMFGVGWSLLIEHVNKLTEELLELHIIEDVALCLRIGCEEYFEVGM